MCLSIKANMHLGKDHARQGVDWLILHWNYSVWTLTLPTSIGNAMMKLKIHMPAIVFLAKDAVLTHFARIGCIIA